MAYGAHVFRYYATGSCTISKRMKKSLTRQCLWLLYAYTCLSITACNVENRDKINLLNSNPKTAGPAGDNPESSPKSFSEDSLSTLGLEKIVEKLHKSLPVDNSTRYSYSKKFTSFDFADFKPDGPEAQPNQNLYYNVFFDKKGKVVKVSFHSEDRGNYELIVKHYSTFAFLYVFHFTQTIHEKTSGQYPVQSVIIHDKLKGELFFLLSSSGYHLYREPFKALFDIPLIMILNKHLYPVYSIPIDNTRFPYSLKLKYSEEPDFELINQSVTVYDYYTPECSGRKRLVISPDATLDMVKSLVGSDCEYTVGDIEGEVWNKKVPLWNLPNLGIQSGMPRWDASAPRHMFKYFNYCEEDSAGRSEDPLLVDLIKRAGSSLRSLKVKKVSLLPYPSFDFMNFEPLEEHAIRSASFLIGRDKGIKQIIKLSATDTLFNLSVTGIKDLIFMYDVSGSTYKTNNKSVNSFIVLYDKKAKLLLSVSSGADLRDSMFFDKIESIALLDEHLRPVIKYPLFKRHTLYYLVPYYSDRNMFTVIGEEVSVNYGNKVRKIDNQYRLSDLKKLFCNQYSSVSCGFIKKEQ